MKRDTKRTLIIFGLGLLILVVVIIFNISTVSIDWQKEISNKEKVAKILKSLVKANKVFIHSDMVTGDVDGNGKVELIIYATVVESQDPLTVSDDLILLSKKKFPPRRCKYFIKARLKDIFEHILSNWAYIRLENLTGDNNLEIILSDSKKPSYVTRNAIYRLEKKDTLRPVKFQGGEFSGKEYFEGKLALKPSLHKEYDIIISYGPGLGVSDTYKWNGKKYVFYSGSGKEPTIQEKKIIKYLGKHINEYVSEVGWGSGWDIFNLQFYAPNKLLAYAEDGHTVVYIFLRYKIEGNTIIMKKIEEIDEYDETYLKEKHNLSSSEAKNYFLASDGNYKWTPDNVFSP